MSLIELKARGATVSLNGNTGFTLPDMSGLSADVTTLDLSSCSLIGIVRAF